MIFIKKNGQAKKYLSGKQYMRGNDHEADT
jgi:hypothetical protein